MALLRIAPSTFVLILATCFSTARQSPPSLTARSTWFQYIAAEPDMTINNASRARRKMGNPRSFRGYRWLPGAAVSRRLWAGMRRGLQKSPPNRTSNTAFWPPVDWQQWAEERPLRKLSSANSITQTIFPGHEISLAGYATEGAFGPNGTTTALGRDARYIAPNSSP